MSLAAARAKARGAYRRGGAGTIVAYRRARPFAMESVEWRAIDRVSSVRSASWSAAVGISVVPCTLGMPTYARTLGTHVCHVYTYGYTVYIHIYMWIHEPLNVSSHMNKSMLASMLTGCLEKVMYLRDSTRC